jgi:hypothetical protein
MPELEATAPPIPFWFYRVVAGAAEPWRPSHGGRAMGSASPTAGLQQHGEGLRTRSRSAFSWPGRWRARLNLLMKGASLTALFATPRAREAAAPNPARALDRGGRRRFLFGLIEGGER